MTGYLHCLSQCSAVSSTENSQSADRATSITFIKELRGEVMLRIAILKKEMGAIDQALTVCNNLLVDATLNEGIRANALCLKADIPTTLFCNCE